MAQEPGDAEAVHSSVSVPSSVPRAPLVPQFPYLQARPAPPAQLSLGFWSHLLPLQVPQQLSASLESPPALLPCPARGWGPQLGYQSSPGGPAGLLTL